METFIQVTFFRDMFSILLHYAHFTHSHTPTVSFKPDEVKKQGIHMYSKLEWINNEFYSEICSPHTDITALYSQPFFHLDMHTHTHTQFHSCQMRWRINSLQFLGVSYFLQRCVLPLQRHYCIILSTIFSPAHAHTHSSIHARWGEESTHSNSLV